MDLAKLKEPFEIDDIEWRVGQCGKNGERVWARLLAYVTNRAIMNRLDDVCGPENWTNEFKSAPNDPKGESLICGIGIQVSLGAWVWKWDGAGNTDIESVKGGISDSMKRAGVQWGIGRYLYDLGESWAECTEQRPAKTEMKHWHIGKTKDGTTFWWKAPPLSAEFLPNAKPGTNRTAPARGDDLHWSQWMQPPAEALESEEPHPWYLQAVKGLLHHVGAQNVGNARKVFAWLSPDDVIDVASAKTNPAFAKLAWERLMDRSNTVPFTRMLNEALKD